MRNSEFTSNSSDIEAALKVLAPTRTVWHQEQAGIVPNACAARKRAPAAAAAATAETKPPALNGDERDSAVGGAWTEWWQVERATH